MVPPTILQYELGLRRKDTFVLVSIKRIQTYFWFVYDQTTKFVGQMQSS